MSTPPQFIDFTVQDRRPVLTVMESINRDRDGWINIAPSLSIDEVPDPPSSLTRIFGPAGPAIPFGTWVPGGRTRRGTDATSLGLRHGSGARAITRLREAGVAVPLGWRVLTDHGRRGLVLELPDDAAVEEALDWLLLAAAALTAFALPGDWRAQVYRRN